MTDASYLYEKMIYISQNTADKLQKRLRKMRKKMKETEKVK